MFRYRVRLSFSITLKTAVDRFCHKIHQMVNCRWPRLQCPVGNMLGVYFIKYDVEHS